MECQCLTFFGPVLGPNLYMLNRLDLRILHKPDHLPSLANNITVVLTILV